MLLSRRRLVGSGALALLGIPLAGATACAEHRPPTIDLRGSGAVADGSTDDTAPIQRAVSGAPSGATFVLSGGTYRIGDLVLRDNITFRGPGTFVFRRGARHMLAVNPGEGGTADPRRNTRNISFDGVGFRGSSRTGFDEYSHLLFLSAASDITIRSCSFAAFQGDAIMLASSEVPEVERHNERVRVSRCVFDGENGENRNAMSVIDVNGLVVEDCHFTRCSRPDMPGPIDLEPNVWNTEAVLADIEVTRNTFVGNTGGVGDMCMSLVPPRLERPPANIRVHHNVFDRSEGTAVHLRWVDREGAADDPALDVVIHDNEGRRGTTFSELGGIRGVTVRSNTVREYAEAVALGIREGGCADIVVADNQFVGVGHPSGAPLFIGTVRDLLVQGNTLSGPEPRDFLRLNSDRSSSHLSVVDNEVPPSVPLVTREPGHQTAVVTNVATGNGEASADPTVFGRR